MLARLTLLSMVAGAALAADPTPAPSPAAAQAAPWGAGLLKSLLEDVGLKPAAVPPARRGGVRTVPLPSPVAAGAPGQVQSLDGPVFEPVGNGTNLLAGLLGAPRVVAGGRRLAQVPAPEAPLVQAPPAEQPPAQPLASAPAPAPAAASPAMKALAPPPGPQPLPRAFRLGALVRGNNRTRTAAPAPGGAPAGNDTNGTAPSPSPAVESPAVRALRGRRLAQALQERLQQVGAAAPAPAPAAVIVGAATPTPTPLPAATLPPSAVGEAIRALLPPRPPTGGRKLAQIRPLSERGAAAPAAAPTATPAAGAPAPSETLGAVLSPALLAVGARPGQRVTRFPRPTGTPVPSPTTAA